MQTIVNNDRLINCSDRDIILVPGYGMVEITVVHTVPGRRNLGRYAIRYAITTPLSSKLAVAMFERSIEFPATDKDPGYHEAMQEESFIYPKKYPGLKLTADNIFLRPSFIPNVIDADIYFTGASFGRILNNHIIGAIYIQERQRLDDYQENHAI